MIKDIITSLQMTFLFTLKNILILLILVILMYISGNPLLSQFIFLAFLGINLFFLRDNKFFIDRRETMMISVKTIKEYFLYGLSFGVIAFILNWILFIVGYIITIYIIDVFNLYIYLDEYGLREFDYFIHVLFVLISLLAPFHFIFILSILKSETPVEILKINIVLRRMFKYIPILLRKKDFILFILIWIALFVLLYQIDFILLSNNLKLISILLKFTHNIKIIRTLIQLKDLSIIIISFYIIFIYSFYSAYKINKYLKLSK